MRAGWSAGAARVPFSVPIGTPMAGYAARTGPAIGVLDELTVGALYLAAGDDRFVLVAADIAAVDAALVKEVAATARLDSSQLVLCASHTHSGPAGVITRMHPGDRDRRVPELRETFVHACAQAIDAAREKSEPVDLLFGDQETTGLAANRNAPDGPFDPHLSVLATRNRAGQLTAALVHFACHPTILSAENRLLSADFPGALRRAAEQQLTRNGAAPVVLFANGAAGDVSTRFTRAAQDDAEVERVGHGLAAAAISALATARDVEPGIATARVSVTLDPRSLDDVAEPEPSAATSELSPGERRKAETRAQGAMLLDRLAKAGPDAIQHTFELPAWRLGDVRLVAVSGELFASLGARIGQSVSDPALVLGYANGYVGYLVDAAAEAAGTYEALASPFANGSGDRVAEAAASVMSQT
jgi:hypothetical protein